ncbi:hypothetical protein MMC12_006811 [Toensbergia leucococca]|nr:hypothetical protein [Toensbergia leucococca]
MHLLLPLSVFCSLFATTFAHPSVHRRGLSHLHSRSSVESRQSNTNGACSGSGPYVTLDNSEGSIDQIFYVEPSGGAASSISVAKGQTGCYSATAGNSPAISCNYNSGAGTRGTRFEFTFKSQGTTVYNADIEMGISKATMTPTDTSLETIDKRPSLVGEPDPVAHANQFWSSVSSADQTAMTSTGQIVASGGQITAINIHKQADGSPAPQSVINFLQLTCNFNTYVATGAIAGVTPTAAQNASDSNANTHVMTIATNEFIIKTMD